MRNAAVIKIKECLRPAFTLPSDNLPIERPAKKPCAISNKRKCFVTSSLFKSEPDSTPIESTP